MTDTVNVPRERVEAFLNEWARRGAKAGNGDILYSLGMGDGTLDLTMTDIRAMLAAAPKVEPVSDPYKLEAGCRSDLHPHDLAGFIEQIQSDDVVVCGGRNIHAENLLAMAGRALRAQPEAQKVKQEPVAWRFRWRDQHTRDWRWLFTRKSAFDAEMRGYEVRPVFDHPAPSSELLEALIEAVEATRFMDEPFIDDDGEWYRKHDAWSAARKKALALIAKHKGPQS